LAGGNEQQLIDYFAEHVKPDDWILCGWRSHYHCILKGVPPATLEAAILAGRSINLCFPEHRVLSSAIVGGIAPIATGLAWAIKNRAGAECVHCFLGDMSAETGIVHEAQKYASRHRLPVRWVIEDNGLSVNTETATVWGSGGYRYGHVDRYFYTLARPHVGIGKWVAF